MTCVLNIDRLVAKSGASRENCWKHMRNNNMYRVELPTIARMTLDKCFDKSIWYNANKEDSSITDIDDDVSTEKSIEVATNFDDLFLNEAHLIRFMYPT